MERKSFDEVYLDWVDLLSSNRSTCLRQKVGACIVKENQTIASGYNGMPSGDPNCCDTGICKKREVNDEDYKPCLHAEQNALMFAARTTISTSEATMYLNAEPCVTCAKLILTARIRRVVLRPTQGSKVNGMGANYLRDHGIEVVYPDRTGEVR